MKLKIFGLLLILIAIITACTPEPEEQAILVALRADGREQTYRNTEPITVGQFLREIELELGPQDRVNPDQVTQITDGMIITVRRVEEREECTEQTIPYDEQTIIFEGLPAGERRVAQSGENGIEEVCSRVIYEDGIEAERVPERTVVLVEPINEIINVGPDDELEPVSITGTIAYINNGNAWIIRGSNTNRRPLTTEGNLDTNVFSLTNDGNQLLFSTQPDNNELYNQVWIITDTTQSQPLAIQLPIQDVRYAEWRPGFPNTISYSTLEITETSPGWNAYNDLWLITIDPATGTTIRIDEVLERSQGGLYGYWGTLYEWSPSGEQLAWIRADSVGLVNFEDNDLDPPLLSYPVLALETDSSWRTSISWSPDGQLITSTVHGPPVGAEIAQTSPVFNVAVAATSGEFTAESVIERAGIWANPSFSPELQNTGSEFPQGYLAYFQARRWETSIVQSDYDLVVADRDGSNARIIFPAPDQPGLSASTDSQQFTWSPDGRQIALIYQGNLWIVDVESGIANQMTVDGTAKNPVWTR